MFGTHYVEHFVYEALWSEELLYNLDVMRVLQLQTVIVSKTKLCCIGLSADGDKMQVVMCVWVCAQVCICTSISVTYFLHLTPLVYILSHLFMCDNSMHVNWCLFIWIHSGYNIFLERDLSSPLWLRNWDSRAYYVSEYHGLERI